MERFIIRCLFCGKELTTYPYNIIGIGKVCLGKQYTYNNSKHLGNLSKLLDQVQIEGDKLKKKQSIAEDFSKKEQVEFKEKLKNPKIE